MTFAVYYVPEHSMSHSGELHSVATNLPLLPHSLHVTSEPPQAAFSTSALFTPAPTMVYQTNNFEGQQSFSVPSAPHQSYAHPTASIPVHSTISTSALMPNHTVAYLMTYAGQPSTSILGPSSVPNIPYTISTLPLPMALPTGSTSTTLEWPQPTGQYPMPAQVLLETHSEHLAALVGSHFLDSREFVFL